MLYPSDFDPPDHQYQHIEFVLRIRRSSPDGASFLLLLSFFLELLQMRVNNKVDPLTGSHNIPFRLLPSPRRSLASL